MDQIICLNIQFTFGNITDTIHPVILKDEQETILIDCGYPNFLSKIQTEALANNINLEDLTKIIITHHDYDHIGALAEFKNQYPGIKIFASEKEAFYISGREKSLRLQQAEALFKFVPDDQKEGALKLQQLFGSVKPADVDVLVNDQEIFPWCGGTEIIFTLGHMPGHISIYLRKYKILISGDALVVENGNLAIANPEYNLDMEETKKSINRLMDYDIEKIICYHGGIFDHNIRESLGHLLEESL